MKRIAIILLAAVIALLPIIVSTAQPRYNASFSFDVTVNSIPVDTSKQVYLYSGDKINISLHLTTGDDYYAGPFATNIFYSGKFLYNNFNWNTSGRFYSACKTYSNIKKTTQFFKVDMIPTSVDCKAAVANVDEKLFSLNFTAQGNRDETQKVYMSPDTVRDTENPFGETYLACYTDNGNLAGERYDYGEGMVLNLDKATVTFKLTDAGDVNSDSKITSADALAILQNSTGVTSLNQTQLKAADVDYNGKVNSSDSLAVLQISTGSKTINEIINK